MITAERLDRDALAAVQGQRLSELVTAIYTQCVLHAEVRGGRASMERLQFPRDLERCRSPRKRN